MFRLPSLLVSLLWCALAFALTRPTAGQDLVQVQFPNADVNAVLDYYAMLTAKRLVRANTVTGPVNIVITERIPKEEAIRIIEINLLMNGYVLVPAGGNIVKVLGPGTPPRSAGIPMFSEEDQLPDGEQIVTFLAKLDYADPIELANTLTQAIPPNQVLGGPSITPLPKSQALLITESTTVVRSFLRIIRGIDSPPAEVKSVFVTLQRADAEEVLQQLEKIFQPTPSATGAPGGSGAPRPVPAPRPQAMSPEGNPLPPATAQTVAPGTLEINAGTTLSEDSVIVGKIRLTADKRTNRIHIVARERNLEFIRGLLQEFDAIVEFGEPITRPLRFVSAGDVLDAVVQAISDPGAQEQQGAPGQQQQPRPGQQPGQRGAPGFGDTGRTGTDPFGGGTSGTGGFSESLSTAEPEVIPETRLVGNTKIIADKRANAIIIIGNKDVQEKVFRVLDEIDVRAPQVMIHTVIGELTLSDNQRFGVDYILRNARGLGTVTPGTGTTPGATNNLVVNPGGLVNPPGLNLTNLLTQTAITQIGTAGAGGLSGFFTAGDALDVIVVALEATNRFRVTQRPSIFTSNNKRAVISSGEEIAIPTNIQRGFGGDNLQTSSSIQFKTVAVKLEVLPLINSDREVTLEIVQSVDQRSGQATVIDGNDVPTIATRALKTNISVPSGATIVLGGLIRQDNNRGKSGIPYLRRIPVIGPLFGNTVRDKSRTELVILLRPVVTVGPREPVQVREREQEFMNLESDLEATIIPPNARQRIPAEGQFRRGELQLREKTEAPGFRK
ncbi:MAG: hypothetical protein M3463_02975 [Verrucomicrobiota bacterium]|nr:hypothetical protein [Verrucomicrobiota bacterium]